MSEKCQHQSYRAPLMAWTALLSISVGFAGGGTTEETRRLSDTLRVATSHYHVGHLVTIMTAKELGFFSAEGLPNVEVVVGGLVAASDEKEKLVSEMRRRNISIVTDVTPGSIFDASSRGEDIYIIGGWRNDYDSRRLMSAPHVRSVADLKNKNYGTRDILGADYLMTLRILREAGLSIKDVQVIRGLSPDQQAAEALRRGEVDFAAVSVLEVEELEREGFNVLTRPRDIWPYGRPVRIMIATGQVINQQPELVKAFLRGIIRSYRFIRDGQAHPENEAYVRALERRLRLESDNEEERALIEAKELKNLEGQPFPLDGGVPIRGLEQMLEEAKQAGEIPVWYTLDRVLRLDLVELAARELNAREELREQYERLKKMAHTKYPGY